MVLAALADAEYRLGAWDDALQHGKMAVARAEDTEQRCLMAPCYAVAAFPLAGRGEWEQAQAYTDAATRSALAVGDAVSIAYATSARALVSAARNNPAEVVAAVEPVLLLDASNGITEPGVLPLRELHVNALIDVGEHDRSEPLLGPLEALAQQRGDPALLTVACRLRGSLEAALGHPRKAEAAYQEGLGHAKGCDSLFSRALLEATYGRFLRHSGRRADAAAQLRAAGQRLARLGAQPYLERCNREVEACGRPYTRRHAEDKAGLTPQERAVARLVADGRSNRQVAQELFLSVKTVEFHLRNVFSKLGIRSRSQLVLALLSTSERS
jgi:DNA-binding CsgD family transcriptional regulator